MIAAPAQHRKIVLPGDEKLYMYETIAAMAKTINTKVIISSALLPLVIFSE